MKAILTLLFVMFSSSSYALQSTLINQSTDFFDIGASERYFNNIKRDPNNNYQLGFFSNKDGSLIFTDAPSDSTYGPFLEVQYLNNLAIAFFDTKPYLPNFIRVYDLEHGSTTDLADITGADSNAIDSQKAVIYVRKPALGVMAAFDLKSFKESDSKYDPSSEIMVFAHSELIKLVRTSTNPEKYNVLRVRDEALLGTVFQPKTSFIGGTQVFELIANRFLTVRTDHTMNLEELYDLTTGSNLMAEGLSLWPIRNVGSTQYFEGGPKSGGCCGQIYTLDTSAGTLTLTGAFPSPILADVVEKDANTLVGWNGYSGTILVQAPNATTPSATLTMDCKGLAKFSPLASYVECKSPHPAGSPYKWWGLNY